MKFKDYKEIDIGEEYDSLGPWINLKDSPIIALKKYIKQTDMSWKILARCGDCDFIVWNGTDYIKVIIYRDTYCYRIMVRHYITIK